MLSAMWVLSVLEHFSARSRDVAKLALCSVAPRIAALWPFAARHDAWQPEAAYAHAAQAWLILCPRAKSVAGGI